MSVRKGEGEREREREYKSRYNKEGLPHLNKNIEDHDEFSFHHAMGQ